MIRKKRSTQGFIRRNWQSQNRNGIIEKSKLKMQLNLTQEGMTSRNSSNEHGYQNIIFNQNPLSPIIKEARKQSIFTKESDELRKTIKELKNELQYKDSEIKEYADLRVDNALMKKELNRLNKLDLSRIQQPENDSHFYLPKTQKDFQMMNSTINTSKLPSTRKLLYNNSNFFNDPVSPRIVNKRNVKFTGKKPLNIEHKQINFGKRNINYESLGENI